MLLVKATKQTISEMSIQLTQKHNDNAKSLLSLFSSLARNNEVGDDAAYMASFIGLIAGRQFLRNVLGDKISEHKTGQVILVPEVSEGASEFVGFLFWTGQALGFDPVEENGPRLSFDDLSHLLAVIKKHETAINKIFTADHPDKSQWPYIALLGVGLAVKQLTDDKPPFTFSDAASYAIAGFIHGSKIIS